MRGWMADGRAVHRGHVFHAVNRLRRHRPADCSLVVLVKKVIRTWLNGMKQKGLLRGHTMASGKRSLGVVQFDTTRNRFLAAGDEFLVKFWDMDNNNILTATDCDGGLPASPRLGFNREGSLLAVTTSDNGIKYLPTLMDSACLGCLRVAFEGSRGSPQEINTKDGGSNSSDWTSPLTCLLLLSICAGNLVNIDKVCCYLILTFGFITASNCCPWSCFKSQQSYSSKCLSDLIGSCLQSQQVAWNLWMQAELQMLNQE